VLAAEEVEEVTRGAIGSSLDTPRRVAFASVVLCTFGQANRIGPGRPSDPISANLIYCVAVLSED